ncbi:MAG: protein phosphatase 2C domain-containing protein [Candidatus Magasanikbacteria bacterium]|nr:protein phosphatase 2C domain-containing protein [Candidatus Magasanikbacteria bacterium]
MPDSEGLSGRDTSRISVAPDAKKEAEIFDKFDFGSAQVESPRHPQQDYCATAFPLVGDDYLVALVADGIGSLKHAADASLMAGELFVDDVRRAAEKDELRKEFDLERITRNLNVYLLSASQKRVRELRREAEGTGQEAVDFDDEIFEFETQFSTTFTAIVILGGKVMSTHLGDSRLYLHSRGFLNRMSSDQTVAEERRSCGETDIKPQDESTLMNYLGNREAAFEVDEHAAVSDDIWLLVSDGVYNVLSDGELEEILNQPRSAQSMANGIIDAVKKKGVIDDASAVVVKVK